MTGVNQLIVTAPKAVSRLSSVALAAILDQSVDCIKLIGLEGEIQYMNGNGLCAMEVDDFCAIQGSLWADLWPEEARQAIIAAYPKAAIGHTTRFRAFCPTAKGSPRWWDVSISPVTNDAGDLTGYLSVSRDISETESTREALEIAAAELKHRLKNTYAMISGLLVGFAKGDPTVEAFARDMGDRMVALSAAQALFVTGEAPCEVDKLVTALVSPFGIPSCPVTIGELATCLVDQGKADAVALVMGELAVNSSKHGALKHGGSIHVTSVCDPAVVAISWVERSNQPVKAHDRAEGQGLRLIERIVRARGGEIAYVWQPDGLTVRLTFQR